MTAYTIHHSGWLKYAPAAYFALVGTLFFVADLLTPHGFTWSQFSFMVIMCVPLLLRRVWAYMLAGICFTLFFSYLLLAGITHYSGVVGHNSTLKIAWLFFFVLLSISCSLWLIRLCIDNSGKNITLRRTLQ